MDSPSKFNNTLLPNREDFYSLLNDENISDDDYKHAEDVWNTFKLKNMGEYLSRFCNLVAFIWEF